MDERVWMSGRALGMVDTDINVQMAVYLPMYMGKTVLSGYYEILFKFSLNFQ